MTINRGGYRRDPEGLTVVVPASTSVAFPLMRAPRLSRTTRRRGRLNASVAVSPGSSAILRRTSVGVAAAVAFPRA
jgi:hypothetical protein